MRTARMRVGVVPQFDNLDPDFTVSENLQIFGRYFGLPAATIRKRMPGLLEFARLEQKADAPVRALSGGMRRRLTVARSLINDPDVLVMDEPTTGLDPQARHLIWERLRSLLASGKTILLTTHFMEEAERLCDELCVIDNGRKIAQGKPHELITHEIGCDVVEVYGDDLPALRTLLAPWPSASKPAAKRCSATPAIRSRWWPPCARRPRRTPCPAYATCTARPTSKMCSCA